MKHTSTAAMRRVLLDELAARARLAHIALERWAPSGSARDRVRVSVVAEWLAERCDAKRGDALSWAWRRQCRHAMAIAGFRHTVKVERVAWYTGIKEK